MANQKESNRIEAQGKDLKAESAWLDKALESAKLKNVAIADELDLNYANWVSQWRTGKKPMPDVVMLWLAKRLGIDPFHVRPSLRKYELLLADAKLLSSLSLEDREKISSFADYLRLEAKTPRASKQQEYQVDFGSPPPASKRQGSNS